MHKLIFIFISLVFSILVHGQVAVSNYCKDKFFLDISGLIRMVVFEKFDYVEKFGEMEVGDRYDIEVAEFNTNGLISKKYKIDWSDRKDTSNMFSYQYVFGPNNQLVEINEYEHDYYNRKGDLESKTKFKYDESGRLIRRVIYYGDGSFNEGYIYTYENGEKIEIAIDAEGNRQEYLTELEMDNIMEDEEEIKYINVSDKMESSKVRLLNRDKVVNGKKDEGYKIRVVYY
jgi:hypothetical protein